MKQNGGAHRTRSHTAKLLPCKRERPGEFSVPKKQQQRKVSANAEGQPPSSSLETHQIPDLPKIRDPPPSSLACPDIVGIEVDYLCSLSQPPPFESAPKLQNCYLGTATTFQQPTLFWALTNSQLVFHKRLSCHYA